MAKQLITWQEKVSETEYDTIYPETLPEQVHINNEIANNLGISPEVALDAALEKLSATDKNIRAQGVAGGTATAMTLSVNVFTLFDGVVVRVKILFDTEQGVTLNVNNTGAKPLIRLDGQPFDLTLRQGVWVTLMYSAGLDGWCVQGWSGKLTSHTQVFTESGTWTVPSGVTAINVLVMGGGSGGRNGDGYGQTGATSNTLAGGGGAGGEMALKSFTVSPGTSYVVTIGKGGAAESAGGATSFGNLLSANGGGVAQYFVSGGNGGSGGGGVSTYVSNGGNGTYGGGGGSAAIGVNYSVTPGTGATNNGEAGSTTKGGNGGKGLSIAGNTGAGGQGGSGKFGGGGGGGGYGGIGGNGGDTGGMNNTSRGGGGGGGGYGLNGNGGKGGNAGTASMTTAYSGGNGGTGAGGGGGGGAGRQYVEGYVGGQGGSGGDGICIVTWTSIDG